MFYSPESEPLGSLFLNSKFVCFTSFFLAQAKPLESHHVDFPAPAGILNGPRWIPRKSHRSLTA
jgi:hypothetical protein